MGNNEPIKENGTLVFYHHTDNNNVGHIRITAISVYDDFYAVFTCIFRYFVLAPV